MGCCCACCSSISDNVDDNDLPKVESEKNTITEAIDYQNNSEADRLKKKEWSVKQSAKLGMFDKETKSATE